jgi:ribosome-associated protein
MSDGGKASGLTVGSRVYIDGRELSFTFARSSGAGGQNVNKVNSKAILRWNPRTSPSLPEDIRERFLRQFASRLSEDGELILMSDVFRDQTRNRDECLRRLTEMLQSVARPPKKRIKTRPTAGSKRRRLSAKKEHSEKKGRRRRPSFED